MDYADLVQRLENWIENTGTEFEGEITGFIENGEARCYREIDLEVLRKYATASINSGSALLIKPSDIFIPRFLTIIDTNNTRWPVLPKDVSFISEFWPDRTSLGRPQFYSNWDYNNFLMAPTPDAGYVAELAYTHRPDPISSTNTETWLSTHAPDYLLYACLVEASVFSKQVGQDAQGNVTYPGYEDRYQKAKASLMAEEKRKRGDEYRNNEPR